MKVLAVSPTLPWPLDRGNRVRLHNFLEEIATRHEVVLVSTFAPCDAGLVDAAAAEYARLGISARFVAPPNLGGVWSKAVERAKLLVWRTRGSGLDREFYANRQAMLAAVRQELADQRPDVLFSTYFFVAVEPSTTAACARVCDTQDVLFENERRRGAPAARVARVAARERDVLNDYDAIVAVSERDAGSLAAAGVVTPCWSIEHVRGRVPLSWREPAEDGDTVLFFGALDSPMNTDAVTFLAREVLPLLRERRPGARLVIGGSRPPADVVALDRLPGVKMLPFQERLEDVFAAGDVLALPLRMGSGLKGRVIEAMEAGTPVVASAIAVEGIPARPGEEYLAAETAPEFADGIDRLLGDTALRRSVSREARRFVEATYSWDATFGRIHEVLDAAVESAAARRPGRAGDGDAR